MVLKQSTHRRAVVLDGHIPLNSPLHRWDPRTKLVGLMSLVFAFALVDKLSLLPFMIGITASLYGLSCLPLSFWCQRLRYPGVFLAAVIALLPFLSGETVWWQWGILCLRAEGSQLATIIAGRFLCILTVSLILIGTTPFLTIVKTLRTLGLPQVLTDMLLLTYRYLSEIEHDLNRMQQAMHLRGFQSQAHFQSPSPDQPSIQSEQRRIQHRLQHRDIGRWVSLVATLLIRSYEQSERVYQAMRLRGYGSATAAELQWDAPPDRWSWSALTSVVLMALSFAGLQIL